MTSSVQPISTAAMSALIQELEPESASLFGDPFAAGPVIVPVGGVGKLARVLDKIRRSTLPFVLQSMNTSKVTCVWRARIGDPDDPLASTYSNAETSVFAAVSGPTAKTLEKAWNVTPEYEVLVAAQSLTTPLDEDDAILLDGTSYDIVGIQAYPHTPPAVAYRYWLARTA